ncbi:MAG: hypothetical protein HPZ91_01955 [Lentisphaeria bacterium]|nr:hypothetical protein [Lentisphaeria bacterium]
MKTRNALAGVVAIGILTGIPVGYFVALQKMEPAAQAEKAAVLSSRPEPKSGRTAARESVRTKPAVPAAAAPVTVQSAKAAVPAVVQPAKTEKKAAVPSPRAETAWRGIALVSGSGMDAGVGFVALMFGRPVIVTTVENYLGQELRRIYLYATVLNVSSVLVSQRRNLVILDVGKSLDEQPLPLCESVAGLPAGTAVTTGDSVSWTVGGTVESVGAYSLGLSGFTEKEKEKLGRGAPLRLDNGEVVGMLARNYSGTEAAGEYYAVRLDNVERSEFRTIDLKKHGEDLKATKDARALLTKMRSVFPGSSTDWFRQQFAAEAGALDMLGEYRWQDCDQLTAYFRAEIAALQPKLQIQLAAAKPVPEAAAGSVVPKVHATTLPELLKQEAGRGAKIVPQKPVSVRCFFCGGSGSDSSATFAASNPGISYGIRRNACTLCSGTGKRTLKGADFTATVTPELEAKAAALFLPPGDGTFFDFKLGMTPDQAMTFSYYQKRNYLLSRYQDGFSEIFIFRGNHRTAQVSATIMEFMFGRLVGVELVMGGSGIPLDELKRDFVKGEGIRLNTYAVDTENTPVDRYGRALITPRKTWQTPKMFPDNWIAMNTPYEVTREVEIETKDGEIIKLPRTETVYPSVSDSYLRKFREREQTRILAVGPTVSYAGTVVSLREELAGEVSRLTYRDLAP